ncbi:MAG: thioredoxin domain-containing protein [Polyangiaceae bacterium]|nr:thioredoxin domain-containing protein [Polyangiaceae bacterium]
MRSVVAILVSLLTLVLVPRLGLAQIAACDGLTGAKREVAVQVLASAHPHDCCDGTLAECLKRKPVCSLVTRLATDVCRRAGAGQSKADIERELARRASSVTSPKVKIDTAGAAVAGDPNAKVEIVLYLCARCPYCSRLLPQLHESVTSGRLKGKAKIIVRPFPIRSHQGSTEGGKAMVAAQRQGKFFEFLLHMYKNFDKFDPNRLPECAASAGLDADRFRRDLADPALEKILVESKKEGIRNRVEATPSVYVERRKYHAELSLAAIEDFIEEAYDRQTGK